MTKQKKIFGFDNKFVISTVVLTCFLIVSLAANIILLTIIKNDPSKIMNKVADTIIQPVSAAEIYPEFICSCCGKPLDPENICCGDMRQKIEYINQQVNANLSKDEIIMKTAKKFGLNSLARPELRVEIKNQLIASAPAQAPQIVFSKEKEDMGVISQSQGKVSTIFNFKNEGQGDLIISKLTTSCGCTSAAIVYQGKEGPSFTMSMPGNKNKNPTNWSVSITPGDTAQVKVYYDPNKHGPQKKAKQFITRTISIFSNDPVEFERQLRIELEQTP